MLKSPYCVTDLHTFRLWKFVGLNVQGFLNHRRSGVKQDGSVVKQAALGSVLGIARKLLAINGYVMLRPENSASCTPRLAKAWITGLVKNSKVAHPLFFRINNEG